MSHILTPHEVLLLVGKTNGLAEGLPPKDQAQAFLAFMENPQKGEALLRQLLALNFVADDVNQDNAVRFVCVNALQKHCKLFDMPIPQAAQRRGIRPLNPEQLTALIEGLKAATPGWYDKVDAAWQQLRATHGGVNQLIMPGVVREGTLLTLPQRGRGIIPSGKDN